MGALSIWSMLAEEIDCLTASIRKRRGLCQPERAGALRWKFGLKNGAFRRQECTGPPYPTINLESCFDQLSLWYRHSKKESVGRKWISHWFKHWNRATKQTWNCAFIFLLAYGFKLGQYDQQWLRHYCEAVCQAHICANCSPQFS